MALLRQLQILLTFGSLALASAKTRQDKNDNDDDNDDTPLPLVIWHGLGDNFANEGLHEVGELAEAVNPGTYVYYVKLDDTASGDRSATFVGNVTDQVAQVCAALAADPILSTAPAIDALGFSQGGQFLRAYIERCNFPPVRSLVTFGSQHSGIADFMQCGFADLVCRGAMAMLRGNTWSSLVQSRLVPAQYFRDAASSPDAYSQYLEHSNFLADINNERATKNATYKEHLTQLAAFAMYLFEDDKTVIPKESAWFDDFVAGDEDEQQSGETGAAAAAAQKKRLPLRERPLYTEDWLGLRALDEEGRLHFRSVPGEHMRLRDEDLSAAFTEFYGPFNKKIPTATPPSETYTPGEL